MDERWYTMDRPKSKYPKMSMSDRAAQFAPFAALTGHKEAVIEQGRITQEKRILSNEEKLEINEKITELMHLKSKCRIILIPSSPLFIRIELGWLLGPCCDMGLKSLIAGIS